MGTGYSVRPGRSYATPQAAKTALFAAGNEARYRKIACDFFQWTRGGHMPNGNNNPPPNGGATTDSSIIKPAQLAMIAVAAAVGGAVGAVVGAMFGGG